MQQICKLFLSINYYVYIVAILFVLILNDSIVFQLKHYVYWWILYVGQWRIRIITDLKLI